MRKDTHNDYVQAGLWKCDKSPTGAHHWIVVSFNQTCKYCGSSRDLDDTKSRFKTVSKFTTGMYAKNNRK